MRKHASLIYDMLTCRILWHCRCSGGAIFLTTSQVNDDIIFTLVQRWHAVTLRINKELRKIALLLVMAGMVMGLASPSVCDEFYNNLLKLNGHTYEIRSINTSPVPDCITSNETSGYNPYRPVVRRGGNSRTVLFRLISNGSLCTSGCILTRHLSLLLLVSAVCAVTLSYYHILFIHLKDGHK